MKDFKTSILFPFAFPAFILLGIAERAAYYNYFNLSILEYLKISEIIIIFLNNIPIYLSLLFSLAVFTILDSKHKKATLIIILNAYFLICIFSTLSGDNRFNIDWYIMGIFTIIITLLVLFFSNHSVYEFLTSQARELRFAMSLLFLFIISLVLSSLAGTLKAYTVKTKHIFSYTTIWINNDTIKSDKTFYYVGKTEDFIFFYDEKEDATNIYPINKTDKILYKLNND